METGPPKKRNDFWDLETLAVKRDRCRSKNRVMAQAVEWLEGASWPDKVNSIMQKRGAADSGYDILNVFRSHFGEQKAVLAVSRVYAYGEKICRSCRLVVSIVAKKALSISTVYANMTCVIRITIVGLSFESLIREILDV